MRFSVADVDGNDIAGISLPEIAVPLATYWLGLANRRFCRE